MGIIHNLTLGRGCAQPKDAHHNKAGRLYSSHPVHFVLRLAFPEVEYRRKYIRVAPSCNFIYDWFIPSREAHEERAGCGMSATSLRSVLMLGINDTWE
jgi:hypothetical protein